MSQLPPRQGQVFAAPTALRDRLGPRFGRIDPEAVAKAEAALKGLSSQFGQWLQDEVGKLEAAREVIRSEGANPTTIDRLFTHGHDLKGPGRHLRIPAGDPHRRLALQAAGRRRGAGEHAHGPGGRPRERHPRGGPRQHPRQRQPPWGRPWLRNSRSTRRSTSPHAADQLGPSDNCLNQLPHIRPHREANAGVGAAAYCALGQPQAVSGPDPIALHHAADPRRLHGLGHCRAGPQQLQAVPRRRHESSILPFQQDVRTHPVQLLELLADQRSLRFVGRARDEEEQGVEPVGRPFRGDPVGEGRQPRRGQDTIPTLQQVGEGDLPAFDPSPLQIDVGPWRRPSTRGLDQKSGLLEGFAQGAVERRLQRIVRRAGPLGVLRFKLAAGEDDSAGKRAGAEAAVGPPAPPPRPRPAAAGSGWRRERGWAGRRRRLT